VKAGNLVAWLVDLLVARLEVGMGVMKVVGLAELKDD